MTVIAGCRNENPHIRKMLESLGKLDRAGLVLDAIVADGESTDGTRQILEEFAEANPWLRVIGNPGRIVSTGLNQAILRATGDYIVRMDAHTVYEPDYVVRCIAVMQETRASNVGGPQRSRAEGFWQRAVHAGFHSSFASGGARFRGDSYRGATDTVPYGCWRRSLLAQLGMFDETLVRNQDDELNLRIRLAGGVVWQDPSIVSWYSPRTTLRGLFRQYLQFGFWRVAVLRKHPGAGSIRHFIPGGAALFWAGLVTMILAGIERQAALVVLGALAAIYLVLSLYASVRSALREGWDLFPVLPLTFAVYQLGYAAGFCAGLVYWSVNRGRSKAAPRVFGGSTT